MPAPTASHVMSHTTNPTWLKYRKALFRRQGSPMNAQPAYFPASDCRCRLISSALWNALAPTSQLLTSVDDEVAFLHGEHMRQTPVAAAVRSVRPKAMRLVAVGDQPFAKIAKPLEVSQAFWRRHTTSAVIARRCRDPVITHTPAPARRCVRGARLVVPAEGLDLGEAAFFSCFSPPGVHAKQEGRPKLPSDRA